MLSLLGMKKLVQPKRAVGFDASDFVNVMKHNSRKTLQPEVQHLLKGLFTQKKENNPMYKLSDFKRIKMDESEFKMLMK